MITFQTKYLSYLSSSIQLKLKILVISYYTLYKHKNNTLTNIIEKNIHNTYHI